jgi:hypothetical protein
MHDEPTAFGMMFHDVFVPHSRLLRGRHALNTTTKRILGDKPYD